MEAGVHGVRMGVGLGLDRSSISRFGVPSTVIANYMHNVHI